MGLLDDAIREHLELKRKHGAGEDELRRQEVEALGPARRDFTAGPEAAAVEAEAAPVEDVPVAPEPAPAGWLDDEPSVPDPAVEPIPEPMPAPDPAPVAEEAPASERRESDTPTQGFDVLSRDDEPLPEGEEDVLEETPDFLQDTPEHDRLWFEQKPPRDFDFDG